MIKYFIFISIFSSPFYLYFFYQLFKKIREKKRWEKINKKTFPEQYRILLQDSFPPYPHLDDNEKKRLEKKILYFLKYKNFNPIGDFVITENMKLIIAAQACLLIVNCSESVFPYLKNIFISAHTFIEKENFLDERTLTPAHVPRLGESWFQGPVVLSWNSVAGDIADFRDGHNVVLHEFAHRLDGLEGKMNGVPKLDGHASYQKWKIFMSKEFFELRRRVEEHMKSDIDSYAATNPSEFFAVTVEEFFEKTRIFKNHHRKLYEIYKEFFKIDPMKWS